MDIVIPFVDCSDKVWMKRYLSYTSKDPLENKLKSRFNFRYFYNYDTIKYVLRGIDKFMPYIKNIFIIVSNIEQIPDYIDQSKVNIILHKDFIPEQYLPTFQANTIEMFLYNIPGLDEEFIYFNDDTIPISPIQYDELFKDGLPCIHFEENHIPISALTHRIFNLSFYEAMNTVRMLTNKQIDYNGVPLLPSHGPNPLLKSVCNMAASMKRHNQLLRFYITTYREPKNLNQYYWSDILYFMDKYIPSKNLVKFTSTQEIDNLDIKEIQEEFKYICINDFGSDTHPMSYIKKIVNEKLDIILPDKCKYENL